MTITANVPDTLHDPSVPEVAVLLGPRAHAPLQEVVRARGDELSGFRIQQISYRPDRRIVVVYEVSTTSGSPTPVVLSAGEIPDGAALIEGPTGRLGAWVYPNDPALPGLGPLFGPGRIDAVLSGLGVPERASIVATRSYRPGKRAVVEVRAGDTRLFVKAVRPKAVAALQQAHRALAPAIRIPQSHGWSPDLGLVVLEALPGRPLSEDPGSAPDPTAIRSVLDRVPALDRPVTRRTRRVESHLKLLRRIVADPAGRLDRVAEAAAAIEEQPAKPVHGDLHSGQILVSGGRLTGLVDIDTVGMGEPADDWANLIAHLHVVALGDAGGGAARYGQRVFQHALRSHEESDLRRRIAATILGYAPGPWLRQVEGWDALVHTRIDASVSWLPA